MSIWVSNRAFEANQAEDVLIHESSHALSFITRNCNTSENTSYRIDAWDYFGGEEKLFAVGRHPRPYAVLGVPVARSRVDVVDAVFQQYV